MKAIGNNLKIDVNGIITCYDDFGNGDIPILFIHGFPFNKSCWQPQIDFFKDTNRVIAYDIRGFGNSSCGEEEISITLFADDLIKFMDALQIKKAIVCGLSMGGYILLNAVNRYSDRFEALVLSDTQCIADSQKMKENRQKMVEQIELTGVTDFASDFVKKVFCEESLNNKTELVERTKNIILSTPAKTITKTLVALAQRQEMCTWLHKISIPVLILCGKKDSIIPFDQSKFLNNKIINSSLKEIDNAGHLSNVEQPDEFDNYLYHFINEHKKVTDEKKITQKLIKTI
jgi:3-oxoadipate enol-lactonase